MDRENAVWSPQLVEELMFRQFIKNEDVTRLLPAPPSVSNEGLLDKYNQSTKILFAYVRNGPVAALASQNVNTAASRHYNMTPAKPLLNRAPSSKAVVDVPPPQRSYARTPTPKTSRAPSVNKSAAVSSPPQGKRQRVEWPASVPSNNALKSNSRSKVAPLTAKRAAAQEGVDADLIFAQNDGELPLSTIFAQYPKALKSVSAVRNASGDWRNDTFTLEEEHLYKKELGFTVVGPSQCCFGKNTLTPH